MLVYMPISFGFFFSKVTIIHLYDKCIYDKLLFIVLDVKTFVCLQFLPLSRGETCLCRFICHGRQEA